MVAAKLYHQQPGSRVSVQELPNLVDQLLPGALVPALIDLNGNETAVMQCVIS